ncbi:MAG: hypothetical protein ABSF45_23335 [Terriglobia bacterium]|jgi:hypothetical protein
MSASSKTEVLANISTTIVAVLLSVVLVKQFLLPQAHPARPPAGPPVAKGTNLKSSLPGVDWARNGRTLVLAISTQCHFCTDSAPFFQRLNKEVGNGVKLLAVLPQPLPDSHQYLEKLGVHVDDIRQGPLNAIGVHGTPTLMLVDKTGIVDDVWEGKLKPDQEEQVLTALKNGPSADK